MLKIYIWNEDIKCSLYYKGRDKIRSKIIWDHHINTQTYLWNLTYIDGRVEIENLKCLRTMFLLYLDFIYHITVDINLLGMHQKFKIFFGYRPHSLVNHPNQTKSLKKLGYPKYYEKFTKCMFIQLFCLFVREWDFTKIRI